MNPATRDWTCPECGNHNGPGVVAPRHPRDPSSPPASRATPSLNGRGPMLAIAAGVVIVLIADLGVLPA